MRKPDQGNVPISFTETLQQMCDFAGVCPLSRYHQNDRIFILVKPSEGIFSKPIMLKAILCITTAAEGKTFLEKAIYHF